MVFSVKNTKDVLFCFAYTTSLFSIVEPQNPWFDEFM